MSSCRIGSALLLSFVASLFGVGAFAQNTLTTNFTGTSTAQPGQMFDLTVAANNVTITRFDCRTTLTAGSAVTYEIWYKTGTYAGSEQNQAAWTQHDTVATVSGGTAGVTVVTLNTPLALTAGTTYGMYVTTTLSLNGIYGGTGGVFSDANLTLTAGTSNGFRFGSVFQPRTWNGTIYYSTGTGGNPAPTLVPASGSSFNASRTLTLAQGSTLTNATLTANDANDPNIDITVSSSNPAPNVTAPTSPQTGVAVPAALSWTGTASTAGTYTYNVTLNDGTNSPGYTVTIIVVPPQTLPAVIYYKFNEGSGTTTANSANPGSGSNPATLGANCSWTSPPALGSSAMAFSGGASGGMSTGWAPNFSNNDSFTIEFWVKGAPVSTNYLLGNSITGQFRIFTNTNGGLTVASFGTNLTWSGGALDNTWHHVAFVFDGTAKTFTAYADGNQVAQNTAQTTAALNTGTLHIGGQGVTTTGFNGAFDEFRVWSLARSQAEIQAAMNLELNLNGFAMGGFTPGGQLTGAQTNLPLLDLTAQSNGGATDLTSVTFTKTGSISDAAITSVVLYGDTNNNGAVDGGEPVLASGTFTGGQVTFTGAPLLQISSGSVVHLLLVAGIPSAQTPGTTIGAEISSSSDVNVGSTTDNTSYPVGGTTYTYFGPVSAYPYVQDFETQPPYSNAIFASGAQTIPTVVTVGAAPGSASVTGTSTHTVVSTSPAGTPHGGSGMLDLAGGTGRGASSMNLLFDMSSFSTSDVVDLEFWWADDGLDVSTISDPMQGVFLSTNGGTTWEVALFQFPTNGTTAVWNKATVNLSAMLTALSLSYTNQMVIRFQMAEDSNLDHLLLDDILVDDPSDQFRVVARPGTLGQVSAGAVDVPVAAFDTRSINSTQDLNGITLTQIGTVSSSDVSNFKLWADSDGNGMFSPTIDTQLGSTVATLSGSMLTFTGAPLRGYSVHETIMLFVTANISATPAPGAYVQFAVTSAGDVTASPGFVSGAFPVEFDQAVIFSAASALPYVLGFETPASYFNAAFSGGGTVPSVINVGSAPGSDTVAMAGTAQVTSLAVQGSTPNSGSYMLQMSAVTNAGNASVAMDLLFDFSAFNVANDFLELEFFWNDEGIDNATDTNQLQGVFLSTNGGATWQLALYEIPHTLNTGVWNQVSIDLSSLMAAASLNYTSQTVIRFQMAEDNILDELLLDDITVRLFPDQLRIANSPVPKRLVAAPGQTGVVISTTNVIGVNSNQTLDSLTVTKVGTLPDSDVSAVMLFADTNNDNVFSTGDAQLGSTTTFTGGVATFTGAPLLTLNSASELVFVVVNLAAGAATNTDIRAQIASVGDVTATPGAVTGTFPVMDSRTTTVLQPATAPLVVDFETTPPYAYANMAAGAQTVPTVINVGAAPGTDILTGAATVTVTPGPVPVTVGSTPHTGTGMLDMAGGTGTGAASLDIFVDLSGVATSDIVQLKFYWNDEGLDPLATTDLYHGVFISTNAGRNWDLTAFQFSPGGTERTWNFESINLSAMMAALSLNYSNEVLIRFQMAENLTSDHLLLDDISLEIMQDIEVSRSGTVLPNNGIDIVGIQPIGTPFTRTYDIENVAPNGANTLNLTSNVQLGTILNCTATITAQPSTGQFTPGQSDFFDVQITPIAGGTFLVAFIVSSDDPDEPTYQVTIVGTGAAPEIDLQRPAGTSVPSGSTDSLGGVAENVAQTLHYFIVNGGNSNLDLTGTPVVNVTNVVNATASVVQQPSATSLAPAGIAPFDINLTPGSGAFSFTITILNNDPDEGTYTITVSGTGLSTPEIDLLDQGGLPIAQGGVISLGNVKPGSTTNYTFTIQNNGNMNLSLIGTPPVAILASNNVTVVVTTPPATTVTVGGSTTFVVSIAPVAAGSFSFSLQILNDDANEGAYTVTVAGFASNLGDSGKKGGSGGDDGGGCAASNTNTGMWGLLLGALAMLAVVLRIRAVRD